MVYQKMLGKGLKNPQKKSYDVIEIGHKMNMTDIQASIGIAQLSRIEEMKMRRKEIWEFYNENLKETSLLLPKLDERKRKCTCTSSLLCWIT